MALRGLKPVVEIQFFDYIWPAYMQIRNELATMRWRSNNAFDVPGRHPRAVRRLPAGRRRRTTRQSRRGALHPHARACASSCPSNALDANGLLRTAIRCDDPVLFLEHKHLYRQTYNKGRYPGPDYMIPFGKAALARPGRDVTIVTYGALVQRSLTAAKQVAHDGIEARSSTCARWPVRLGRDRRERAQDQPRGVVHEDALSWGYGAEIAARIADELFEHLDAPVRRVGRARHLRRLHPEPRGRHPAAGLDGRRRAARDGPLRRLRRRAACARLGRPPRAAARARPAP